MNQSILDKANYWAQDHAFDEATRAEICELLEKNAETELTDRFYRDLEFGTGGLRGILGAGSSRMNIYNVRKATTALCRYIHDKYPNHDHPSLAISYDSRNFSREFAEAAAGVAAALGVKAIITKQMRPVPMLSYLVRMKGCQAGICLTASHNPPNYNGYKVYMNTGSQVVPPDDKQIIDHYNRIQDYGELRQVSFKEGLQSGMIEEISKELDEEYFEKVQQLSLNHLGRENFKIVFTPLHGTAAYPVNECLRRFGFKDVLTVPEQEKPNGDFPTVKFPNPEDPAALAMAVDLAQKHEADLVLGTDPDCDRVGIVFRENDEYVFLNGNQIGSLLIEYFLSASHEANRMPENPLVIKTVVTTDMQNSIAQLHGAHVEETLTGFKWICKVIEDYEQGIRKPYRKYVCGGEESYGFLADNFVRDKDGVIACCVAAEMTAYYKSKGKTLSQVLRDLYRKHGVYQESLHTMTLPGKEGADKIKNMMEQLRTNPPTTIDGVEVANMRDLQNSQEFTQDGSTFTPTGNINLPSSNVLQFILKDGTKISARPSGTEPKIKFYVSVKEDVQPDISDSDLRVVEERCRARVGRIEETFVGFAN